MPAVLQKNPSGPTNGFWSLVFQHFQPFPTMTVQSIDLSHANYKYCFLSNKVKLILLKG